MIDFNQKSFSIFNANSEFSFSSNNNHSQSLNNNYINKSFKSDKPKINILKKNLYPFNSNSKKDSSFIIDNSNPGPGEYYKTNSFEAYKKNIKKNDSFISREKRFNYYSVNVPGPGTYFQNKLVIDKKNFLKKDYLKYSLNNNYHLSNSVNSSVSTIPSKEQKLGYYYNDKNELKHTEDPEKNIKYSGELNDNVGPAKYNPIITKNKNPIVKWEKTFDSSINKKKNNFLTSFYRNDFNFLNLVNNSYNSNNYSNKIKQKILSSYKNINNIITIQKSYSQLFDKKINKKIIEEKNKEKEEYKNYINKIDSKQINFILNFNNLRYQYQKNKHNFEYFGSSSFRNTSLINDKENNTKIGPGSYFKEKKDIYEHYKKKLKIIKNDYNNLHLFCKILKKSRTNPNFILKNNFNINNQNNENDKICLTKKLKNYKILNKSFSNKTFGLEKRFKELFSNINLNPGPGQYNTPDIWKKENIKYNIIPDEKEKKIDKINKDKLKLILQKNEIKNNAYNYQNDKFMNLIKNNLKYKNFKNIPFTSHSIRFKENKNINSIVGPGTYNINNKSYDNIYNSKVPFNSSSNKIIKEKYNYIPVQYSSDNYFDWNKKSYNIIYA